jgi:transcriptional regulator with XRE-family HTH domain
MTEVSQLMATLKTRLRAEGLTYRDVARALGLSEVSVKRLFKSGRFTLDRLAELATLLGFTLAELTQAAQADVPRLRTLSEVQECELVSDQRLLLVAVCALNHWTMAEMVAVYLLTEAECIERLLRMDRLGLIALLPGNRIRIKVARDFDWLPDGPIRHFFRAEGQGDFLNSAFRGPDEELVFTQGMLTEAAIAELRTELRHLRQKFAALHDEAQGAPLGQRRGTGLFLAMREWEPRAFVELRRAKRA